MSNLITADEFEIENPNNTTSPVASASRLVTADEFEREYVTLEAPKVSDVVSAPMRAVIGLQEGMERYEKVPAQLMVYMGNAIRQGSARAKMAKNRPDGLYNEPEDMQFTVGQRLLNLGMRNLKLIQERQAKEAVQRDEKFDFARDLGAGAPSIIQSVLLGATAGPLAAGAAVGVQMLGGKTEQMVGDPEGLQKPFMGFGDRGADKLVSQPLINALVESGIEASTLTTFLGMTGPFLQRTIKQTITEGVQEFVQSAGESAVDIAFQTRDVKEIPDALVESVYSFALGAALGGPTAMGFNTMNRNATISHFEEMTGDRKKAIKLADIALEGALDDVTTILETESAMKQAHGEIYEKMYSSVYDAVEKSGAMADMNDDQKAEMIKVATKSFADQAIVEATRRNVPVSEIISSADISVNAEGNIVIVGGEGTQRLEQGARPQDFATAEEYVASHRQMYHQTTKEGLDGIRASGFKIIRGKAGGGDELPIGINTKTSPILIRLEGKEQLGAYLPKSAKVKDFDNRESVVGYLRNKSDEYNKIIFEKKATDVSRGRDLDALEKEELNLRKDASIPEADKKLRIEEINRLQDELLDAWKKETDDAGDNAAKIASEILIEEGFDAIYIKEDVGGVFGNQKTDNLIVLKEGLLKPKSQLTAEWEAAQNQKLEQSARASITKSGNQYVIELLKTADPSSIPHELAHFWLDNMFQFVKSGKASTAYKNRWKNISEFLAITPGQDVLTVPQQEKWAKSYEAYLYKGATPSPNLANEYNAYRQWLRSVYKDVSELGIELTPQAEAIFDSMVTIDKEYVRNLKTPRLRKKNTVGKDVSAFVDEVFVPLSTRASKVDESLKVAIRRFMFNVGINTKKDIDAVKPFIDGMSKLNEEDFKTLDMALKNRDMIVVDEIINRNGLQVQFTQMQQVIEDVFDRAKNAGLDVGYLENYFPRRIESTRKDDYLNYLRGGKQWTNISREIRNVERETGRMLSEEELAEVADKVIRGYGEEKINAGTASNIKSRKISTLTADQNAFYKPSPIALVEYITDMNDKIESAKFIGNDSKNVEDSIGAYVDNLIQTGVINSTNEGEVRSIIKALIGKRGTKGLVSGYKNFSYIYTMGSPISAITQISDLAFSLYKNGFFGTIKALTGKKVTRQDVGIDNIAEEFSDTSKSGKAVNAVFNAVGLSWMDGLGKATILTGALNRLSKNADNLDLESIFGDSADQVRADLKAKNLTDDVKFLLFSELADVQPITLSEMPEAYVAGGNARLWYMLKSYTIKQLDVYHNEVFRQMNKNLAKGFQNLLRLTFALMLMGMSSDALKDLLLGRPIRLSDLVVDNILKAVGFSKYTIYKAKREGALTAAMQIMNPPIPFIDDIIKDISNRFKDEPPEVKDMRIWNALPVVGKFYYWWFGGGRKIIEDSD